ncbi:MAG: hypothetical protein KAT15_31165, partial [Bacteroidales bacterium]|nr:hypothetical protein [Bacteroidales bacterium]
MNKVFYIGLFLVVCQVFQAYGQDHDLVFSGNFEDIPFADFVSSVEQQTGGTFYYFDTWVSGVRISAEGTDISLTHVLNRALLPAGIHHYIDEFENIYLSNENPFIPSLPYPDESGTLNLVDAGNEGSGTISGAEQRYIEGHKSGLLETLVVGNTQSGGSQKEFII